MVRVAFLMAVPTLDLAAASGVNASVAMPTTHVDAVLTQCTGHGKFTGYTYWFRGKSYWKHDDVHGGWIYHEGHDIASAWKGMPTDVDAVFSMPSTGKYVGNSYWFKGNQYWKYNDVTDSPVSGYPKLISKGWGASWPDNIDAILPVHSLKSRLHGLVYFFKGTKYWKWDSVPGRGGLQGPTDISAGWSGMPTDIDAIVSKEDNMILAGNAYFLKGNEYWKYDLINDKPVSGYPRSISSGWPDDSLALGNSIMV